MVVNIILGVVVNIIVNTSLLHISITYTDVQKWGKKKARLFSLAFTARDKYLMAARDNKSASEIRPGSHNMLIITDFTFLFRATERFGGSIRSQKIKIA